ncbi:MAG: LemA family protein [Rikenellaceae bacterium]
MKKTLIILGVVAVVIIVIYSTFKGNYNNLVKYDEGVKSAWSSVESQYQRRADLIPNLVSTVKGYAEHESSTLEAVVAARASATKTTINVEDLSESSMQQFNKAQGELSSALSRLLVVSENYPDLKANENFRDLQAQLEGTENRIATERKRYNDTVINYNSYVRSFPRNILASMFGFETKPYYEAEAGSEKAPEVKF